MDEPIYDYKGPGQMGLSPLSALEWLWEFVKTQPENQRVLVNLQIKMDKTPWENVPQVTIRWCQASSSKRQSEKVLKTLQQEEPWVMGHPQEPGFQPLGNGLASLLLESGPPFVTTGNVENDRVMKAELLKKSETAHHDPKQKLLVVPNLNVELAARLFWELPYFTTQRRTARAETAKGVYQLYWMMSDRARGGNLDAFQPISISSGDCHMLDCYVCQGSDTSAEHDRLVFGPKDRIFHREALRLFCAIVTNAPDVFGQSRAETKPLAALVIPHDTGADTVADFLHLGQLRFSEEWEMVARPAKLQAFELINLETSASEVEKLGHKIDEAHPRLGYELQLRRSAYTSKKDREIERLRLLQRKVGDRLADLQGFRPDHPTLLRFTPQQLPILGDVLRYYAPNVLNRIRYGFEHTNIYGAGLHFLYLEPGVRSLADLDPLSWWGPYGGDTMRFWLDPAWARSYDASNNAEVFVPYGWTLYPTLHSWHPDEMDGYLEQTVKRLASEKQVEVPIPEAPIYLFDSQGQPGEKLHLSILDRAALVPLETKLGWLNANLLLMEDLGLEDFVRDMADLVSRRRLAQQLHNSVEEVEEEFTHTARELAKRWAQDTASMLQEITKEVNRIIQESHHFLQDAQKLNQHLADIQALHRTMQTLARGVDSASVDIGRRAESVQKRYGNLTRKVQAAVTQAQSAQADYDRRVNNMISALEQTHEELQQRLQELRRLG